MRYKISGMLHYVNWYTVTPDKQPPVMHQIAGWVGSRVKLEVVEKRKIS